MNIKTEDAEALVWEGMQETCAASHTPPSCSNCTSSATRRRPSAFCISGNVAAIYFAPSATKAIWSLPTRTPSSPNLRSTGRCGYSGDLRLVACRQDTSANHRTSYYAVQRMEALVNSPHPLRSRTGDDQLMTKLSEYVKIAEASHILGISQNTLRAWAEAGKLPVRRNPANGYRLFLRRDLEAFLGRVASGKAKERKVKN